MVVIKIEIQQNVCYYCNYRQYHVGENECKDYSDVHVLYTLYVEMIEFFFVLHAQTDSY